MICNNCGSTVGANEKYCPNCGSLVDTGTMLVDDDYANDAQQQYAQPQYAQPQYAQPQYAQPDYSQPQYGAQPQYYAPAAAPVDPALNSLGTMALVFGIISVATSSNILGIIFGILARKKAKAFSEQQPLTGKAKVGNILGLIGLILGIVATAIVAIYLLIVCAALVFAGGMDALN